MLKLSLSIESLVLSYKLPGVSIFHLLSLLKGLAVGTKLCVHVYVCNHPHLSGCISKSGSLINTYLWLCSKAMYATELHQAVNVRSIMCFVCVFSYKVVMNTFFVCFFQIF